MYHTLIVTVVCYLPRVLFLWVHRIEELNYGYDAIYFCTEGCGGRSVYGAVSCHVGIIGVSDDEAV